MSPTIVAHLYLIGSTNTGSARLGIGGTIGSALKTRADWQFA
jgi:hypothetical protein